MCKRYIVFLGLNIEKRKHPKSHSEAWWISEEDYKKLKEFLSVYSDTERKRMLREKTNLERHGVACFTNRKKDRRTKLERYGDEKYNNPEKISASLKKNSKERTEKIKKTKLERYGDKNYNNKQKTIETNLKRYGCIAPAQNKKIQEKIKQTNLARYGCEWAQNNKELIERRYQKYGAYSPTKKYIFEGKSFDSLWEAYFFIYNKYVLGYNIQKGKRFSYCKDGKERYYECDFLINGENVEIKGDHFLNEKGELVCPFTKKVLMEKTECMRKNNVRLVKKEEIKNILKILKKEAPDKLKEIISNGKNLSRQERV